MSSVFVSFIGLPGSGKSTLIEKIIKENKLTDYVLISADEIKKTLPGYDENNPELVHEESVKLAEQQVYEEIRKNTPLVIFDTGGINNSYSLRILNAVKNQGYFIRIYHLDTPVQICIERNLSRTRIVPIGNIREKALKMLDCVIAQKKLANNFVVIPYYTHKHVFVDMDGVIAHYQKLMLNEDGLVDYVNYNIFERGEPVTEVIRKLNSLSFSSSFTGGSTIYILSASPNSFCTEQKNRWLDKYFNIPQERRIFVGRSEYKALTLKQVLKKFKISKQDCTLIDDFHETLIKCNNMGINAIHPSEFLAKF